MSLAPINDLAEWWLSTMQINDLFAHFHGTIHLLHYITILFGTFALFHNSKIVGALLIEKMHHSECIRKKKRDGEYTAQTRRQWSIYLVGCELWRNWKTTNNHWLKMYKLRSSSTLYKSMLSSTQHYLINLILTECRQNPPDKTRSKYIKKNIELLQSFWSVLCEDMRSWPHNYKVRREQESRDL